jgi:carbonic anhydrase
VVSVFFDRTAGNTNSTFLASLNLEKVNGSSSVVPIMDIFKNLETQAFYQYDGSLTTPTCDETVQFNILRYPFPISDYQLNLFNNKWANNTAFANGNGNNRLV